jgi:hypothetical protein
MLLTLLERIEVADRGAAGDGAFRADGAGGVQQRFGERCLATAGVAHQRHVAEILNLARHGDLHQHGKPPAQCARSASSVVCTGRPHVALGGTRIAESGPARRSCRRRRAAAATRSPAAADRAAAILHRRVTAGDGPGNLGWHRGTTAATAGPQEKQ